MTDTYRCKSEDELLEVGRKLLDKHASERIFAFIGPMGVGKTSFIKALCYLLGVEEHITSPTFSIINEYMTLKGELIFHFDMYRVEINEVFDIGYEEYFFSGNYCLIEWADRVEQLLPVETVIVKMEDVDGERVISF